MKRVGVVVEGPSDSVFWKRFLGKMFSQHGYTFDVRSMKGGNRVIQEAPNLVDDFHKAGYHSAIIILDADKAPCATVVLERFVEDVRRQARQSNARNRFVHVFVAFRELESWVLADEECVRSLIGSADYHAAANEKPFAKAKFVGLCREQNKFLAGLEDLECARSAAGLFDAKRAVQCSTSFAYFWNRLNSRLLPDEP